MLVGVGFGYLFPNPMLKWATATAKSEDEPIHNIADNQQLDGPLPGQHSVAMENETE